ncbi:MAG: hypothetical protein A2W95_11470 [Bacteroidetes bacterium GWA2_40_14]|nr:MAG: hypothetical protein A2W95_11470 [Bacteroidetes bacterium GWA2_40_14]HAZ04527.1 TIGR02453 family protein [Marinilabiliales bacterium]
MPMLTKNVIPFLTELASNNNKLWFDKNRTWYQAASKDFKDFIDELIPQLVATDPKLAGISAKDCVYRIFRDVRFSNDKTPYKISMAANVAPGGKSSKLASFYIHVEPTGKSIAGGGIYMTDPPFLKAMRNEFFQVPEELLDIFNQPEFKKYFNGLWEEDKLKTAPKGFPKDFEHIDLLKHKHYIVLTELTKADITGVELLPKLVAIHRAMYPLNRLINTIFEDAGLV